MSNIHKVWAAVCIGGFAAAPVMCFRYGVAQAHIIMIEDDVPSEPEVRAAVLRQEKKEDDEDLALLKSKLNQDVSRCRSFSISQCIYTNKTMFGQPLNNPGWYYSAPFPPNARPFDSQNSCAQAAVNHCEPGSTIVGNDQAAVEIQKDRAAIENFRYTADDWVIYVRSINNYEGNIVVHVTFRKKRTESDTYGKKISMERRHGTLIILAIEDD
jgi:hypothetical protein